MDVFIPITPNGDDTGVNTNNSDISQFIAAFNSFLSKYRELVIGFFGIATLFVIGVLIYSLVCLGGSGANPQGRRNATTRIVICCVAIAVLGSIILFITLTWNALK